MQYHNKYNLGGIVCHVTRDTPVATPPHYARSHSGKDVGNWVKRNTICREKWKVISTEERVNKIWRHGLKMGNIDIDDASKYLSFYAMLLLGAIIILFIFQ